MIDERRKEDRFPVLHEIDEPIQLTLKEETIPGVLVDLSANGMAILSFTQLDIGTEIHLSINLPSIKTKLLRGKTVWVIPKGEMFRIGISFTEIDPIDFRRINRMGFDHSDCDTKIELGVSDVCYPKCSYFQLCHKPQKLKEKTKKKN